MNSILLSAISLSGYCGFLLKPHTEGVEENARAWAAVATVRHRRCRRFALSSVHGFALRASPAVKHGVSPPGTVGEHAVLLGRVNAISERADRIRVRVDRLILFSNTISA